MMAGILIYFGLLGEEGGGGGGGGGGGDLNCKFLETKIMLLPTSLSSLSSRA